MSIQQDPKVQAVIGRIDPNLYRLIEKRLASPSMNENTTPQQTGFMLGIQAVLRVLRDEFVR